MLKELHLLWDRGYRQVEFKSDNALLEEIILVGEVINSIFMKLQAIHKLIQKNWRIRIRHIPRVYNVVANFMGKHAATGFTSIWVFIEPSHSVRELVQKRYYEFLIF